MLNDAHEEILTMELLRGWHYDDLTDIYNKTAFIRRLTRDPDIEMVWAMIATWCGSVQKMVNELFGFDGGNRYLRHLAKS